MLDLGPLVRVIKATPLVGFNMHLVFEDGSEKDVDLSPFLGGPIFKEIRENPTVFRKVKIVGGTIAWENGADIDPDVLYYDLTPAGLEPVAESS